MVSSTSYIDGATGGNVLVTGRRAARKLGLLASGGDPAKAGEGLLAAGELAGIAEAAGMVLAESAAAADALLGEQLELTAPSTRTYETVAEAMTGLDLAPRATWVTFTVLGETIRLVHLVPNALLIHMTQTFDEQAAARTFERFGDPAGYDSVPAGTVLDVTVSLRAELGRTRLSLLHASGLGTGAAVTLDRRVDDPVELFVNGRRFGAGDLIAVGGRWAVRITEITGVSAL